MNKTIGILAHVDSGKTTFSEQILYHTNSIRNRGRVDHKDTFLDSHNIEKERGITVFSDQGVFEYNDSKYFLVDTPGHIDFSTEMERSIAILDYAILVISGVEGVQGHTRTLWNLLRDYNIPILIFINKLDRINSNIDNVINGIKKELSDDIVYIDNLNSKIEDMLNKESDNFNEKLVEFVTEYDDVLLEKYLEGDYDLNLWFDKFKRLIKDGVVFPCFGGSALQDIGIVEFLDILDKLTYTNYEAVNEEEFAGRVYKIRYEENRNRITFIKCLRGNIKVKDEVQYGGILNEDNKCENILNEKINSLRIYNGSKYKTVNEVAAGELFAVTGISSAMPGDGVGTLKEKINYEMIPTLMSKVNFDDSNNVKDVYKYSKILESEDPALNVRWDEALQELHVHIMGKIQLEVLRELVYERFKLKVEFGTCQILYKETIDKETIGCGHFEPLRHYAEVHLKIEPIKRNSGIVFENKCHTDHLTVGHQNLVRTHIFEREHHGLLTGSAITDIKVTLLTGRAHNKHTCGGDFREATYRALRQGLEKVNNILLEPYYRFVIEASSDYLGKVMADIQKLSGTFEPHELLEDKFVIRGRGPVATFMDYSSEVIAFTRGKGSISLIFDGYDICHNSEEVIAKIDYDKNSDIEYTSNSIFCSHGQGYLVNWDKADKKMHCINEANE